MDDAHEDGLVILLLALLQWVHLTAFIFSSTSHWMVFFCLGTGGWRESPGENEARPAAKQISRHIIAGRGWKKSFWAITARKHAPSILETWNSESTDTDYPKCLAPRPLEVMSTDLAAESPRTSQGMTQVLHDPIVRNIFSPWGWSIIPSSSRDSDVLPPSNFRWIFHLTISDFNLG